MKCNRCQVESPLDLHIGNIWYCVECSKGNLHDEVRNLYAQRAGHRILFMSNSVKRLDSISDFILKEIDIFNLRNSMILILAEGVENILYPVDIAYVDDDIVCDGWSDKIKFKTSKNIRWVGQDWKLHDKSLQSTSPEVV